MHATQCAPEPGKVRVIHWVEATLESIGFPMQQRGMNKDEDHHSLIS